ncbi:hypothetical protein BpHYR1_046607 [Brachionus plicatilis]|uniref:Uncharacterized protein n=1 Tax=Brachionus plicatilis TaxID=10195 RepID=A0A3M7S319_BRAPC|nr:hypothetical protein BpHYR1_046607 [Brachionus plicatilis]
MIKKYSETDSENSEIFDQLSKKNHSQEIQMMKLMETNENLQKIWSINSAIKKLLKISAALMQGKMI